MVNWVEAGAPRGEGADPLAAMQPSRRRSGRWASRTWSSTSRPSRARPRASSTTRTARCQPRSPKASGCAPRPWAKADARRAPRAGRLDSRRSEPNGRGFSWNVALGGYGPGGAPNLTPTNMGTYLPPGGAFAFQMHYTPFGKPMTDDRPDRLYFYKEEPKYILRQASDHRQLDRDPGRRRRATRKWPTSSSRRTRCSIRRSAALPLPRCYSTKLRIRYPDGKREGAADPAALRLQLAARLHLRRTCSKVPAGSQLIAHYVYDNSEREPGQPRPDRAT